HAGPKAEFNAWMTTARTSSPQLTADSFQKLARPSENNPVTAYSLATPDLYDRIVVSFMAPQGGS
ncbi:MAG TPA: COX aromatic rich motif-containing protein, partial [Verrucomicrobiae bacterium]|nr:COX aromatic rich motif-containing protein [Verrucomicrobiae bacterium]